MNRFIEVLKELKRHRPSTPSTIVCPQCQSPNIYKSTGMDGWLLPPLYLCPDCGYSGRVVLEVEAQGAAGNGSGDGQKGAVR